LTYFIGRFVNNGINQCGTSQGRFGWTATLASLHMALLLVVAFACPVSAQIIETVAGGGIGDGGPATAAMVNLPSGVAVDSSGNLYFADAQRIRKVTVATGTITTVAGTGAAAYNGDNIIASSAALFNPSGVAVDSSGNLYIADRANQRIRKVTAATGLITTVAGTGEAAYNGDNIAATNATLNLTSGFMYGAVGSGIAVDSFGNLYIADVGNQRIRKVTATTGIITTVAGTGSGGFNGDNVAATSATLSAPAAVAVDSSGNLYILDRENHRVRKVTAATGVITTVAGTGTIGGYNGDNIAATSATWDFANGITVDSSGNFYIVDTNAQRIRKVTVATGVITTVAGAGLDLRGYTYNGDNISATSALLYNPFSVAIDSTGNLYIADTYNSRIRKVTAATGVITTVAGTGSYYGYNGDNIAATRAALNFPKGVAVDLFGKLLIADAGNNRIRKVTGGFAGPAVITNVAGGSYGSDIGDNFAAISASLNNPSGVAVDSSGNFFIADTLNNRIRKVTADTGIITTVAGAGPSYSGGYGGDNNVATSALLNRPVGVAVDSSGNLYVADTGNNRVRKVSAATGLITTVAGTGSSGYNGDNIAATNATLSSPYGIAVDSSGNLYIADTYNNRVRKVAAATGIVTTAAIGYYKELLIPAPLQRDLPSGPSGIAVDSAGNVYFADFGRIRKLATDTGIVTTLAGGGRDDADNIAAISASLNGPIGVAVDSSGNLYIAEAGKDRIRRVAGVASATSSANYQGLWWNAPAGSESGWGINFAHQGDIIFATWFTYDATGKALWLTMTANKIGTDYVGTLYQTRGPAFSAVPFAPAAVTPTAVGSGTLTFSDASNGRFTYTLNGATQTKSLTRQVFGPLPSCTFGMQPNLALATNYQDLWWAAPGGNESGWGVNFTHQGDTIFATWFTYDVDGAPLWLSATASKAGTGIYTGTLYRTTGPPFNSVPFLPANIGLTAVGTLTLTFANGNAATFAYTLNGVTQSKSITRQVFNAPGTVCQ